eukprot:TRINITY_DN593_c0_g1_i1.p1 TRINITY_DN593_c0_g1~~TRINITY_DN593_c0_g1_i1.p1  ORF type:complete len:373 (+),score=129.39 TRINITY_DN593_c0_g1_i1:43-1161(+)
MPEPTFKPYNPCFSSGPCAKRPGFNEFKDPNKVLGRSHRAKVCKDRINKSMSDTLRILGCPPGFKAGIVPASDTGAVEMILWSLMGEREVDAFHYDTFGTTWANDLQSLGVTINSYKAEYGKLPDFSKVNPKNDVVFPWNGTTSGACVPNGDWIPADREGLVVCDATSAAFAVNFPWDKLDITTFSWQKALGGEAAHGVIVFSPRALERIRANKPDRPLPKIFSLSGKMADEICAGNVINTVSMMCVEDYLKCLEWVDSIGGLEGTIRRTAANFEKVREFVEANEWVEFLCDVAEHRSKTSVCLVIKDLDADQLKKVTGKLEAADVAYDIGSYRDAPSGIRVWCGATVEAQDVEIMLQWLKHCHDAAMAQTA